MSTARSKTAVTTVAPTTATRTAGIVRVKRGSTSRTANVIKPSTIAVELRSSNSPRNARTSSTKPSASVENPHNLGS